MPVKVLVADDDLDVHELVNDILCISYKDVKVDRALDASGARSKIKSAHHKYDLLLVASELADAAGKRFVAIVMDEFPDLAKKMAVIEESGETPAGHSGTILPMIKKPFSLDDFSDVIKKICPP